MGTDYFDPGGIVVPDGSLAMRRSMEFIAALRGPGALFASLVECRSASQAETVIFDVEVQRPQIIANDIRKTERIAAVFKRDDESFPDVLALRTDFPELQHQNPQVDQHAPRSLCLYDRPWCEVRVNWTAPAFVERVRWWLQLAARDELHAEGQGLEPFLISWGLWLVLPAPEEFGEEIDSFSVSLPGGKEGRVLMAFEDESNGPPKGVARYVVLRFTAPQQRHRVMPWIPRTLADLASLLQSTQFDLLSSLRERLKAWPEEKKRHLQNNVILLVDLPKTRREGGAVESVEHCAALTSISLLDLGVEVGAWGAHEGKRAVFVVPPDGSKSGTDVQISLLNVCNALTRDLAAHLNGLQGASDLKVASIGAGALGSHVAMNLARAGWGRWTVVDHDDLLPHNLARHAARGEMVGCRKAFALAWEMNWVFGNPETATFIPANVLRPESDALRLTETLRAADLILDVSASVAVSRHLSGIESSSRRASLFLSPSGRDLVLLAEGKGRTDPLNHLELMYYLGVASDDRLKEHFDAGSGQVRYGLSCRDVSSRITQDSVATFAGIGASGLRQAMADDNARIRIWLMDTATMGVLPIAPDVESLIGQHHGNWALQIAPSVLRNAAKWRAERLPNETGGVLMGNVDHDRKTVYLMKALPSPPNSDEWPCHYIRGCEDQVKMLQERTAMNLSYIGEWHSHPDGCATVRSTTDMKAFAWIAEHTLAEGKPPVMLIAGDGNRARIFVGSAADQSTPEELCLR